jgi:aminopeptidase N
MNALAVNSRSARALACALALLAPALLQAQVDPRWEMETGRDTAVWPPPRHFDHVRMVLELDIPDMDEPRLGAVQRLTLSAIGAPRTRVRLDAGPNITVRSVESSGRLLEFTHADSVLEIDLSGRAGPGEPFELVIRYDLEYPAGTGVGLTWTPGDPSRFSETDRAAQIHTQGQPQFNHTWFPCHDFPNERVATELIISVDERFQAVSNGRLEGKTTLDDGRVRWHWIQDLPHPYYLVVLVIGDFAEIDLGGPDSARPNLPMTVFTPHGTETSVREAFGRTPDQIAYFETLFDEPYPFAKYHQLIVRNFSAGAMENTTAVTFAPSFATMSRDAAEGTIAHELVHHWFGDMITCKSWEHLWLNEGWASYGQALWREAAAPPEEAREEYLGAVAEFFAQQRFNMSFAPTFPALASNYYTDAFQNFVKPDNVYQKGPLVLHMLREELGDEVFWRATREYIDRFAYDEVETDDFRRTFEEVSGRNLEQFFNQWVHRPGLPKLRIDVSWDDQSSVLIVDVAQTQVVNRVNSPYVFDLPIRLETDSGPRMIDVYVDAQRVTRRINLAAPPSSVNVNPDIAVAAPAAVNVRLP